MKDQSNILNVIDNNNTLSGPFVPEKLTEQAFYLIALALTWKSLQDSSIRHSDQKDSIQIF